MIAIDTSSHPDCLIDHSKWNGNRHTPRRPRRGVIGLASLALRAYKHIKERSFIANLVDVGLSLCPGVHKFLYKKNGVD